MAKKEPVVRKISLSSKKSSTKKVEDDASTKKLPKKTRRTPAVASVVASPFTGTLRYVKGSWQELRQVRWPNRSATWSLTLAVIVFTLFFSIVILILDFGFQYLFKEVLLK